MNKVFKYVVFVFCILWLSKEVLLPVATATYYSSTYMDVSIQCDSAMNSSWFIRQKQNPSLEKTEQIQMLDCHEYDMVRKKMLISGLPEDYLSYLGLKALEIHQKSAEQLVDQHRFTER